MMAECRYRHTNCTINDMKKSRMQNSLNPFSSLLLLSCCVIALFLPASAEAERVKDIASISGVRANPLIGYGLVVGLDGTGDNTNFGKLSLKKMLLEFGINTSLAEISNTRNLAVVALHAELPAFAKPGQKIDVTVSAMGNAKSLHGGSLLLTPLQAANGTVYAIAQGNLVVGTTGKGGKNNTKVPVVGRIPNGATIELEAPSPFQTSKQLIFNIHRPDFTTATRLAKTINDFLGGNYAKALDGASVQITAPKAPEDRVSFLSAIENLEVETGVSAAKIIVNSRTGTIVIGQKVTLSAAAVSHGNLTVSVADKPETIVVEEGASLEELVNAINKVGASPADLVAVLDALQEAGALEAELIII